MVKGFRAAPATADSEPHVRGKLRPSHPLVLRRFPLPLRAGFPLAAAAPVPPSASLSNHG